MEIQQNISAELNESLVGKMLKVIIDRKRESFLSEELNSTVPKLTRRFLNYPVEYDLKITGNFYNILITKSTDFDLYGIAS